MIFCARATRGLGRPSLDARSEGQPRPPSSPDRPNSLHEQSKLVGVFSVPI